MMALLLLLLSCNFRRLPHNNGTVDYICIPHYIFYGSRSALSFGVLDAFIRTCGIRDAGFSQSATSAIVDFKRIQLSLKVFVIQ